MHQIYNFNGTGGCNCRLNCLCTGVGHEFKVLYINQGHLKCLSNILVSDGSLSFNFHVTWSQQKVESSVVHKEFSVYLYLIVSA